MKRSEFLIFTVLLSVLSALTAVPSYAQDIEVPEGYELVDSVIYRPV